MEDNNETDTIGKLVGIVPKVKATGGHKVDIEKIKAPMEETGSVIHSFCEGCGYTLEITQAGAEKLARMAKVELPSSLEGRYFVTKCCDLCDGTDLAIRLEKI